MLPQLAVSAKILCLLMVVICGTLPSMHAIGRSVRLHNSCSHNYVNVLPNGTVMARSVLGGQPNLTTINRDPTSLDLLIYSPIQEMYLCFSGSKLMGRKISREKAERMDKCLFREKYVENGYSRYRLANHEERYIGFNRNGMQIRRLKSRMRENQLKCLDFMKDSTDFDISRHNHKVAKFGGPPQQSVWPPRRRALIPKSARGPCHNVRHGHGLRRRNCDFT